MTRLAIILLCLAGLYATACAALYLFQRSFIYFPQAAAVKTPLARVDTGADKVEVVASVRIPPGPVGDALVYFGGNGEDVTQNLQPLAEAFPDHAIYLLHYRGYGASGGRPSEEAIQRDALALFDSARQHHAQLIVIGRSLGTGVAIRVASQRPAARLVLVTPYDSLQELAAQQFPWFPVRWLLADKFESWRSVPKVRAPTLLIAAEHDEVIPLASTEQLFARFEKGAARLEVLPGVAHNTIALHPRYVPLLRGDR